MFSFFKTKKASPTQIPGDAIPAPPPEDDVVVVDSAETSPHGSGLYPAIPGTASGTAGSGGSATTTRQRSEEKLGYALRDVPFRLSSDLNAVTNTEETRIQVNEIMAFVGSTMTAPEYDFSLERSVLDE